MNVCTGIAAVAGAEWGSAGISGWQILGAFLLVGGLLVLVLKGLSRWQGRSAAADMRLVSVTPWLRRSLEALRYGTKSCCCTGAKAHGAHRPTDAEEYESRQAPPTVAGLRDRLAGLLKRDR